MKPRRPPKGAAGARSNSRAVIALAVMGALVLLYGWNSLILSSKSKAKAAVARELAAAHNTEGDLRQQLAKLRQLAADTQSREAELVRIARLIPADPDVAGAILALHDTAEQAQVAWASFTPSPANASAAGGSATVGLSIRIGGTFPQIFDYLRRLEALDRLVVVDSVSLSGASSSTPGSPNLEADLKARMFAAKGPAPTTVAAGTTGTGTTATATVSPDTAALSKDGN